jgi:hypothetical protein
MVGAGESNVGRAGGVGKATDGIGGVLNLLASHQNHLPAKPSAPGKAST